MKKQKRIEARRGSKSNNGGVFNSQWCQISIGGRLSLFNRKKEDISALPWINSVLKEGLKLKFVSPQEEIFVFTDFRTDPEKQKALVEKVNSLPWKVLVHVPTGKRISGFYSTLFLVRKLCGSFCTIIKLKLLNLHQPTRNSTVYGVRCLYGKLLLSGLCHGQSESAQFLPPHSNPQLSPVLGLMTACIPAVEWTPYHSRTWSPDFYHRGTVYRGL